MVATNDHIESLVALGLNTLEAEIYSSLLSRSPGTGYGVAKALGKPASNVYKALEALESKGAVVVDDSENRHYRAVPAAEFLCALEREFDRYRTRAAKALESSREQEADTRIYQIRSRRQVLERARRMLAAARRIVLMDVFPTPAEELRSEIEDACGRGVQLIVKTYDAATELDGPKLVLEPDHENTRRRWPGEWLCVMMDGSEFLYALLAKNGDGVIQAIWSESPTLSWILQSSFSNEIGYTELRSGFERQCTRQELAAIYRSTRSNFVHEAPGYFRLLDHLGQTTPL